MVESKGRSHIVFAALSFASPFIAFGLISLYQAFAYEELPTGPILDDADKHAPTLLAFVMVVEIVLAVAAGCVVGLLLAALSLWKRKRALSLGTAALIFNGLPLFLLLWVHLVGI